MFRNLFWTKRPLLARINGIQRLPIFHTHPFLAQLEWDLTSQYQTLLRQEELYWYQKSRAQWIHSGDRNTRFYHVSTITRRRRNKIEALKTQGHDWCQDQSILKAHVRQYFVDLFGDSQQRSSRPIAVDALPQISQPDMELLTNRVELWETTRAVKSMHPYKAPDPDGFQPFLFQRFWNVVGPSVHSIVVQAFETGTFDARLNDTLLVLIPKLDNPETVKQFRPISLCNVVYKIISKVMVMRLQKFIFNFVNPLQASFIPGRHAADNILIAQEMVHSIHTSQATRGGMLVELDLEKAYDKVDWKFLLDTLRLFCFPEITIKLISSCISSTSLAVLWNGERTTCFKPGRGLRQGDPLSPYLFVLYLERLSARISLSVRLNHWKPFSVCRGGPLIPHLMLADDILLLLRPPTIRLSLCLT